MGKSVSNFKLSAKGAKFITDPPHEGLKLTAYPDSAGVWTIGFGTTTLNGHPVSRGMAINELVAWALFYGKVKEYSDFLSRVVKVKLNQNQIDALISLVYNIGMGGFAESTLLRFINTNQIITEDLFTRWNKVRINGKLTPSKGLTARRKREYALFMSKEL